MLVERPETKPKTKKRLIRAVFVILVLVWLFIISVALVAIDDNYKQRIKTLELEVKDLKAGRAAD